MTAAGISSAFGQVGSGLLQGLELVADDEAGLGQGAVADGAAHAQGQAAQEAESGLGGEDADDFLGRAAVGGFGKAAVDDGGQGLPGLALAPLAALGDLAQQVDERGRQVVDVQGERRYQQRAGVDGGQQLRHFFLIGQGRVEQTAF